MKYTNVKMFDMLAHLSHLGFYDSVLYESKLFTYFMGTGTMAMKYSCCSLCWRPWASCFNYITVLLMWLCMCSMQRCSVDVSDIPWPAGVEDAKFLVLKDGAVELSSIDEQGIQLASVCLSPTRHTFTVRFLAKVGQSSSSRTGRPSVLKGEFMFT